MLDVNGEKNNSMLQLRSHVHIVCQWLWLVIFLPITVVWLEGENVDIMFYWSFSFTHTRKIAITYNQSQNEKLSTKFIPEKSHTRDQYEQKSRFHLKYFYSRESAVFYAKLMSDEKGKKQEKSFRLTFVCDIYLMARQGEK